mgnify:CR=1 FL=1
MNSIYNLFSFEMVNALSWTLLHSIWQGLLIACLLSILIKHAQSLTSKSKSLVSLGALTCLLVISIITFFNYYEITAVDEQLTTIIQGDWSTVVTYLGTEQNETYGSITNYISENSQYIVLAWLLGFVLFLFHLLFGLYQLRRLKKQLKPLSNYWQDRLERLSNKLNYSGKIVLGESRSIQSPITFGLIKPVILFPVGMVNQLSILEVEAIMAHELAHIIRKDYLINFLQTLLEGIYYFNPGVWIISSIIRNQREHCCDDMAIELTGNSVHYLKALVAIEESKSENKLALGFSNNKKPLLKRVQRILNQPQKNNNMKEKLIMTFIFLLGFLVFSMDLNSKDKNVDESIHESEVITIHEETPINEIKPTSNISTAIDDIQSGPRCQLNRRCQLKDTIPSKTDVLKYLDDDQKYLDVPAFEEQIKRSDVKITIKDGDIKEMEIDGRDLSEEEISKIQYNLSEDEKNNLKENARIRVYKDGSTLQTDDEYGDEIRREIVRNKAKIQREKEIIKKEILRSKNETFGDKERFKKEIKAEKERIKDVVKQAKEQAREGIRIAKAYSNMDLDDIEDFDEDLAIHIREAFEEVEIEFDELQEERIRIVVDFAEEFSEDMEEFSEDMEQFSEEMELFSEEMEDLEEEMEDLDVELLEMQEDLFDELEDLDELIDEQTITSTEEIIEVIANELIADNLIENRDEYSFLLKKNKFQVNGKSPSSSLKKKYETILEDLTDNEWSSDSKLKIVKKGTSSFTEFSIKN